MRMYDIIEKKRNNHPLTKEEINFVITNYVNDKIPDYQVSALLMAIYFNGLDSQETVNLTMAMAESGDMVDLSDFGERTVDKHSTGGVGDKTTLIVAPIVAACGSVVAKMSGRGLGHTGGTVDKLQSIPDFKVELSQQEFRKIVKEVGVAVVGQSGNLAPADKKLYALRDVTATVDNISLIASSIMSKKIAAGNKNIVLDVKVGSGAFMKTTEQAEKLAKTMVQIGKDAGRNVCAVITDMDIPLGNYIGNSLEVKEALDVLSGNSDECEDLKSVCLELASNMVSLSQNVTFEQAKEMTGECLYSKKAYNKFIEMVTAQGGDITKLTQPQYSHEVVSETDGYISAMNSEEIGLSATMLGAGRETKNDEIDYNAGIKLIKKYGDKITKGETIAILYADKDMDFTQVQGRFLNALSFSKEKPKEKQLIYGVISNE